MLALGVVHQGHAGAGDVGQVGDLARVVHAQLDHRRLMRGGEAQQRQRQAHVVVEVALRGQGRIALVGAQHGGQHLRDGGLAVAAGHGYQRQIKLSAPAGRQRAQGRQGVGHLNAGQARRLQPAMGNGGGGAGRAGLGQKGVGVETLALQGHEQVAGLQRAGVGVHARQRRGAVAHQARGRDAGAQQLEGLLQRHHGGVVGVAHATAPRRASASRACAMSENGWRWPAVSW